MEGLDPVAREFQRIDRGGIARLHRGVDLGRGHAQAGGVKVEPVELARRLDQRRIASISHVVDDRPCGALDVGRSLALRAQELLESLVEIGVAFVQANGHGGFLAT